MTGRLILLLAASAMAANGAETATAQTVAAGSFTAPVDLSEPGSSAYGANVALDGDGNAVAVWLRSDGPTDRVQISQRPAAGEWAKPQSLSAAGRNSTGVSVAAHPAGDAAVTWCDWDGTRLRLMAVIQRAGGPIATPQQVSPDDVDVTDCDDPTWGLPHVAFGASGGALAVWATVPPASPDPPLADHRVQAADLPADAHVFGPARTISPAGSEARNPQAVVDAGGAATVLWRGVPGDVENGYFRIQAVHRPPGEAFSVPEDLSDPESHAELQRIATDPAGNAVAVWSRVRVYGRDAEAAVRPAGGVFGSAHELSSPFDDPNYPGFPVHFAGPASVAVDRYGNAIAVWRETDRPELRGRPGGSINRVLAAVRPADDAFGAPQVLSAPGRHAGAGRVAFDSAGNAVAVWRRRSDTTRKYHIQAAVRPPGGVFGTPVALSDDAQNAKAPRLALNAAGNGVLVWRRRDGARNWRIQAARYSPAARR